MEIKKNEKVRLENYSLLFFELGLVMALLIIYVSLESKTQDKTFKNLSNVAVHDEIIEDIPIVQKMEQLKPPPPPPPAQEKLEIVDNQVEVEEAVLESTETNENEAVEVIEIEAIEEVVEEEEVIEDIPFAVIEEVPVYPGCKGTKQQKKKCLAEKVVKHVAKHFNTNLATELSLQQGKKRVFVQFKIDKKGFVSDIKVRGPHKTLEKEAERVVKLLPKMMPGKQRGRNVAVRYNLPITFQVL